ncbi:MAG: hypothetical protein EOP04_01175 [Proteobacteria bacterium]|nr:MAG: hypothetical protein EOP04_01175 [Pseudomonadota bacterium]
MDIDRIKSYRDILTYQLNQFKNVASYRTKLATKLGFHPSHLSHVMRGTSHLTYEQGMALCLEWKFTENVTDLFLNLVSYARSGTEPLKEYYAKKISEARKKLCAIAIPRADQTTGDIELDLKQSLTFASHWRYATTLALLNLSPISDLQSAAVRLKLDTEDLSATLKDLLSMGLVRKDEDCGWIGLNRKYTFPNDWTVSELFHKTLRQRSSIARNFDGTYSPLRFTRQGSCSIKDSLKIRHIFTEAVVEAGAIMINSNPSNNKDSHIVTLCIDLFRI